MLAMVFVLSSFLDNIAAAMIGGTMATALYRGRVHVGFLAAIVAASNAGGAGSVVGDTTTTMMWIAGVSPRSVLEAYAAAIPALLFFGTVAARQQHALQPIVKDAPAGVRVDPARVGIVAVILAAAIASNLWGNLGHGDWLGAPADHRPGGLGWRCSPARRWRDPTGASLPSAVRGAVFLVCLVLAASMMPVEALPARIDMGRARPRLRLRRLRQHPAHRARLEAGRLRLGLSRLRRRLRRLDDLVRLFGRGRAGNAVSRGTIGARLGRRRLACRRGLRARLRRARCWSSAGTPTRRCALRRRRPTPESARASCWRRRHAPTIDAPQRFVVMPY